MTFTVLIYAIGGYAVVLLAAMLVLEHTREPVHQARLSSHAADRVSLRPWPRAARGCPMEHERALPLRSAQRPAPPRRRRPTATSCRR
jgi:hypothetical protein